MNDADEALRLVCAEVCIDAAVLDINVHDRTTYAVADELRRKAVPFVFATGYDQAAVPPRYRDIPRWEKPFDPAGLVRALLAAAHQQTTRAKPAHGLTTARGEA